MSTVNTCEPYLWESARGIGKALQYPLQKPESICHSEIINAIFVWYFLAVILGVLLNSYYSSVYPAVFLIMVTTGLLLPSFFDMTKVKVEREALKNADLKENFQTPEVIVSVPTTTFPTARNPFMNLLIDEIKYNPTRPPAANIGDMEVKTTLDDFFRVEFTSDPTDVFGRSQSQRQFITMPSTTVPNDANSYQNWLYKIPGKTCKEGGREACLPGTDGGQLPWLNVER